MGLERFRQSRSGGGRLISAHAQEANPLAVCIKSQIQNLNLVIGCTIGCTYCYARSNVRRFRMIEDFEKPEYFPRKLRLMEKARPQIFLLTGMSDFSGWRQEWRDEVFAKMADNPQHQYLFLTKRPEEITFSTDLDNAWFGVTVTSSREKRRIAALREHLRGGHYHVTVEPMFDDIGEVDLTGIEWIVIGTETGRRKGKSVSKPEWVWNLTDQAHALGIPVFWKEDLLPILGQAQMIQELPRAFCRVLEEQAKWRK